MQSSPNVSGHKVCHSSAAIGVDNRAHNLAPNNQVQTLLPKESAALFTAVTQLLFQKVSNQSCLTKAQFLMTPVCISHLEHKSGVSFVEQNSDLGTQSLDSWIL